MKKTSLLMGLAIGLTMQSVSAKANYSDIEDIITKVFAQKVFGVVFGEFGENIGVFKSISTECTKGKTIKNINGGTLLTISGYTCSSGKYILAKSVGKKQNVGKNMFCQDVTNYLYSYSDQILRAGITSEGKTFVAVDISCNELQFLEK